MLQSGAYRVEGVHIKGTNKPDAITRNRPCQVESRCLGSFRMHNDCHGVKADGTCARMPRRASAQVMLSGTERSRRRVSKQLEIALTSHYILSCHIMRQGRWDSDATAYIFVLSRITLGAT